MNRGGLTAAGAYAAKANLNARPPKRKLLMRLAKYLISAKWLLLAALMINIISNLLALIGPRLSGSAIDAMTGGRGNRTGLCSGISLTPEAQAYKGKGGKER